MESQSFPLPRKASEPIVYHFTQQFDIKPVEKEKQYKMMKAMVKKDSKEQIKFLIVSEPMDDDDKDCDEVG